MQQKNSIALNPKPKLARRTRHETETMQALEIVMAAQNPACHLVSGALLRLASYLLTIEPASGELSSSIYAAIVKAWNTNRALLYGETNMRDEREQETCHRHGVLLDVLEIATCKSPMPLPDGNARKAGWAAIRASATDKNAPGFADVFEQALIASREEASRGIDETDEPLPPSVPDINLYRQSHSRKIKP